MQKRERVIITSRGVLKTTTESKPSALAIAVKKNFKTFKIDTIKSLEQPFKDLTENLIESLFKNWTNKNE